MKHEDFDNEIGALFEEDSVLAQAVINLQERRKRISDEDSKTENENLSEKSADDNSADDGTSDESAIRDNSLSATDSYDFSATVEVEEIDDADLSLIETEALAVNPADVIPYTEEDDSVFEAEPKQKKKKLFGKSEKKSSKVIKLLDFVANENTVSNDKNAEKQVEADKNISDENEKTTDSVADFCDSEAVSSPEALNEEIGAIHPEPDEQTALPESDQLKTDDDTEKMEDTPADTEDSADTIPFFDDSDPVFLTRFDDPAPTIESEPSPINEPEDADTIESDISNASDDKKSEDGESESVDLTETEAIKSEKSRFIDGVFDFIELFIFSLAAVLLITTFFFRHSVVEGSSMEQTLFDGEHIIISKLFYKPERGDIIVCEDYSTSLRKPIVKRIIAIPGDTVVFLNNGTDYAVFVNGEELDEDYVYLDGIDFTPSDAWIVGEDEVFVMGDHRNNSTDSRAIGAVKIDSIIGKALLRFYPFDTFGKIE